MAESKAKSATKGPTNKSVKDSKVWSLVCLAREVGGDAEGIQDYTHLVAQKNGLESEVDVKSQEITRLKQELAQHKDIASTEKSLLMREFGEQYKIFAEKTAALEAYRGRVAQLEIELETMSNNERSQQRKLQTLEADAKSKQTALSHLQKTMETAERDCIIHRSQLQAAQEKCDDLETRLRTDLGCNFFHEIDDTRVGKLRDDLTFLSKESYTIVKDFIADPEPAVVSTTLLQNLQTRFPGLPQPAGLTKEAVLMRRAAGQAIICEALMAHIFRPFYIPDDMKEPASQMLEFFSEDKEQQQIFRYQVLKLLQDEDTEPLKDAVMEAGFAVSMALDRLISPARLEEFRHRIENLLCRAAKMWVIEAQQAGDLIEVMSPGNKNEPPPQTYQEYGIRSTVKGGTTDHHAAAILFPRMAVKGQMLHVGQVVWSDSPAAMIARDQVPSPTLGRAGTIRKNGRRNSVAGRTAT
ncbi:hypothetical protein MGU_09394 [Metarhizium guizhouense ARSEF 977]|uniref:MEI5 protein n=1 Tax=Metarhizium guizhouense (strain ARSEF 977) TaxID=1276136 RepID=A0A0B4GL52_METGA|nr:hypothetical protein MGU_09394 [Metarhizium guizhouense ARSEF 977]